MTFLIYGIFEFYIIDFNFEHVSKVYANYDHFAWGFLANGVGTAPNFLPRQVMESDGIFAQDLCDLSSTLTEINFAFHSYEVDKMKYQLEHRQDASWHLFLVLDG